MKRAFANWYREARGLVDMIGPNGSVPIGELKRALKEIDRLQEQYVDICCKMREQKDKEAP